MAYDWLKIKTAYLSTENITLDQLAINHGVAPGYLREVAGREKWKDEKEEIWQKASARLAERMPETIAQVKLRHARLGRNIQNIGIATIAGNKSEGIKPMMPTSYQEAMYGIKVGVQLERDALGMNEKEVKDELYQRFAQFTFIFNLSPDELRRFIKSANTSVRLALSDSSGTVPETGSESGEAQALGSA